MLPHRNYTRVLTAFVTSYRLSIIAFAVCATIIDGAWLSQHSLSLPFLNVQAAQLDEILLQDNFDQPDSTTLGGPWKEIGEVNTEFIAPNGALVGPAIVERAGGTLAFHYKPHSKRSSNNGTNGVPTVYAPLNKAISSFPATVSFTFSPNQDTRIGHLVGLMSAGTGFTSITNIPGSPSLIHYEPVNSLGLMIGRSSRAYNNSYIRIVKFDGGKSLTLATKQTSFQFQYGTSYTFAVTINADFSTRVEVTSGSQTEVLTAGPTPFNVPLDQFLITDLDGGISFDSPGDTRDFLHRFDSISVKQPAPRCLLGCSSLVPQTGVVGTSVSFSGSNSQISCAGPITYDWDFGDGKPHGTTPNASHAYTSAGTYKWTLTITSADAGSIPCVSTGSIQIAPAPATPMPTSIPTPTTSEILLQDKFNRTNNASLGGSWIEVNEVLAEFTKPDGSLIGPSFIELDNQTLTFLYRTHSKRAQNLYHSGGGGSVAYRPLVHPVTAFPVSLSFKFTPTTDERLGHYIGLMSAAGGLVPVAPGSMRMIPKNGFGVYVARSSRTYPNSSLSLLKHVNGVETIVAQRAMPFQFTASGSYTVQLSISADFSLTVQVSNGKTQAQLTGNPGIPNFPLDQFFIDDKEGSISFDSPAGDYLMRFDDVEVKQGGGGSIPSPTPTATPKSSPTATPTPSPTPKPTSTPTPTPTPQGTFEFTADTSILTVIQGETGFFTVRANSRNGFSGNVALLAYGVPGQSGATAGVFGQNPIVIPSNQQASFYVAVPISTSNQLSAYSILIIGQSGNISAQVTLKLTVEADPQVTVLKNQNTVLQKDKTTSETALAPLAQQDAIYTAQQAVLNNEANSFGLSPQARQIVSTYVGTTVSDIAPPIKPIQFIKFSGENKTIFAKFADGSFKAYSNTQDFFNDGGKPDFSNVIVITAGNDVENTRLLINSLRAQIDDAQKNATRYDGMAIDLQNQIPILQGNIAAIQNQIDGLVPTTQKPISFYKYPQSGAVFGIFPNGATKVYQTTAAFFADGGRSDFSNVKTVNSNTEVLGYYKFPDFNTVFGVYLSGVRKAYTSEAEFFASGGKWIFVSTVARPFDATLAANLQAAKDRLASTQQQIITYKNTAANYRSTANSLQNQVNDLSNRIPKPISYFKYTDSDTVYARYADGYIKAYFSPQDFFNDRGQNNLNGVQVLPAIARTQKPTSFFKYDDMKTVFGKYADGSIRAYQNPQDFFADGGRTDFANVTVIATTPKKQIATNLVNVKAKEAPLVSNINSLSAQIMQVDTAQELYTLISEDKALNLNQQDYYTLAAALNVNDEFRTALFAEETQDTRTWLEKFLGIQVAKAAEEPDPRSFLAKLFGVKIAKAPDLTPEEKQKVQNLVLKKQQEQKSSIQKAQQGEGFKSIAPANGEYYVFGEVMGTFNGVDIHYNFWSKNSDDAIKEQDTPGNWMVWYTYKDKNMKDVIVRNTPKWQCKDLITRYLNSQFPDTYKKLYKRTEKTTENGKENTYHLTQGNAASFVKDHVGSSWVFTYHDRDWQVFQSGNSSELPQQGDIIATASIGGNYGHIMICSSKPVINQDGKGGYIEVVEQNYEKFTGKYVPRTIKFKIVDGKVDFSMEIIDPKTKKVTGYMYDDITWSRL